MLVLGVHGDSERSSQLPRRDVHPSRLEHVYLAECLPEADSSRSSRARGRKCGKMTRNMRPASAQSPCHSDKHPTSSSFVCSTCYRPTLVDTAARYSVLRRLRREDIMTPMEFPPSRLEHPPHQVSRRSGQSNIEQNPIIYLLDVVPLDSSQGQGSVWRSSRHRQGREAWKSEWFVSGRQSHK
jgi:hypothetical protein